MGDQTHTLFGICKRYLARVSFLSNVTLHPNIKTKGDEKQ